MKKNNEKKEKRGQQTINFKRKCDTVSEPIPPKKIANEKNVVINSENALATNLVNAVATNSGNTDQRKRKNAATASTSSTREKDIYFDVGPPQIDLAFSSESDMDDKQVWICPI